MWRNRIDIADGAAARAGVLVLLGAILMLPGAGWCAEAGSEAAGGGSWLSLLFYVINFALFVWILARYAAAPARKFFADRAAAIKESFSRAEGSLKEAQELSQRAADRMARLEAEKKQLRDDLDAETVYIVDRIRAMTREAALRIVRDTELTGAAITEGAQRQMRATLAQTAGKFARDLIGRSFTADDQERLLRGFEDRLAQEARR